MVVSPCIGSAISKREKKSLCTARQNARVSAACRCRTSTRALCFAAQRSRNIFRCSSTDLLTSNEMHHCIRCYGSLPRFPLLPLPAIACAARGRRESLAVLLGSPAVDAPPPPALRPASDALLPLLTPLAPRKEDPSPPKCALLPLILHGGQHIGRFM
mmetsp:Transcript_22463/g.55861  ORF Transcript_22463/g.55861 Transcript_22463/m.55861 type:complete len:158 (-) Transcript_22463:340-813(-)